MNGEAEHFFGGTIFGFLLMLIICTVMEWVYA